MHFKLKKKTLKEKLLALQGSGHKNYRYPLLREQYSQKIKVYTLFYQFI